MARFGGSRNRYVEWFSGMYRIVGTKLKKGIRNLITNHKEGGSDDDTMKIATR